MNEVSFKANCGCLDMLTMDAADVITVLSLFCLHAGFVIGKWKKRENPYVDHELLKNKIVKYKRKLEQCYSSTNSKSDNKIIKRTSDSLLNLSCSYFWI